MNQTNQQLFANYLNLVVMVKKKLNILKCENDGLKRRVKSLERKNQILKQNIELQKTEKKLLYQQLQAK